MIVPCNFSEQYLKGCFNLLSASMVTLNSLDVKENMEKATDNNLFTNDYASDAIITAVSDKEWLYYWSINWRLLENAVSLY